LAEDGRPENRPLDGQSKLDDHAPGHVPESEEPGLIASMKGM
jgi:hypothetical protein